MKKVIIGVIIVMLTFSLKAGIAHADYIYKKDDTNVYFRLETNKLNSLGTVKIALNKDNEPVYPLYFERSFDSSYFNEEFTNNFGQFGLTDAQINKLELLSHYGYGYKNRTAKYWYALTILEMWRVVYPDLTYRLTDKTLKNDIDTYDSDLLALQNDVKSHVSFDYPDYHHEDEHHYSVFPDDIRIGGKNSTVGIDGTDRILSHHGYKLKKLIEEMVYTVSDRDNEYLTSDAKIYLNRRDKYIYFKGTAFHKPSYKVKYTPKMGTLKLKFKNEDGFSLPNNNCYMVDQDVAYQQFHCVKNNEIIIDDLYYGEFNMRLIKASPGYVLDRSEEYFYFDEDHQEIEIEPLFIKGSVQIEAQFCKDNECSTKSGVEYEIYDEQDNLVSSINQDEQGVASTNLFFGKYKVTAKTNQSDYESLASFSIDINEDNISYKIAYKSNYLGNNHQSDETPPNISLDPDNGSIPNSPTTSDKVDNIANDKNNSNNSSSSNEVSKPNTGIADSDNNDKDSITDEIKKDDQTSSDSTEEDKDEIKITITERFPLKIPVLKEPDSLANNIINTGNIGSSLLKKDDLSEEIASENFYDEEIIPPDTGVKAKYLKLISIFVIPIIIKRKFFNR